MSGAATRPQLLSFVACTPTPLELEHRKLERLRELRATIDALRHEQASQDPLLTWAIEQECAATPHRD